MSRRFLLPYGEIEMNAIDGKRVIIIGGGIGGLTAACALAARGAYVTVLEQAREIKEVGAGLQISPNGGAVLRAIGVMDALLDRGAVRAEAVQLRDYRGAPVVRLDLLAHQKEPYFFVHRADLIDALAARARELDVNIELDQYVTSVSDGVEPNVQLGDGNTRNADLIVGADGIHSKMRPLLNGDAAPFFTHQVAWRAIVPNTIGHGPEAQVHMAPGRHLVSYPLRGGKMINLVAVQERRGWIAEGWNHRDTAANLQAEFHDFGDDARAMLAAVDDVFLWGLFRHDVADVWHGTSIALIGDGAHPTLPFMAQGAVMAIEDAWVLADELAKGDTIAAALAAYQTRRMGRVVRVIKTASGNAWKYHLRFPPVRFAAHMVLRIFGRIAPRRMVQQFDWIYRHDVTRD